MLDGGGHASRRPRRRPPRRRRPPGRPARPPRRHRRRPPRPRPRPRSRASTRWTPLPATAAALPSSEVRKIVTIIFSDLKGSTALTEKIDAEAINEVKERYFTSMAAEITRHGGKIEKYIGDAIMAVFGLPRAHEDDALRAVRAAHGMTVAMDELNKDLLAFYGVEIAARTGVNTGEVVANSDPDAEQRLATGDAVNVAARLEQAAPANEVLIGEVTYSLVRPYVEVEEVEPLELKGKAERVPAYRLIDVRDAAHDHQHDDASMRRSSGASRSSRRCAAGLREVAGRGGARIATVLGEAGVGKSYLVDAFQVEVGTATTVLRGRCLPYGDGITFWPLVEVLRAAAAIADDDSPERGHREDRRGDRGRRRPAPEIRDRLASVAGLSSARFPVTELFWGARKFLEALSAKRPVVLFIEDIHNAEETFLDLLEHLLDATAPAVRGAHRGDGPLRPHREAAGLGVPPGRDDHPDARRSSRAETERLVEVLLDGPVEAAVKARVVASSEGNPLFVAQLVSMLVEKGLVHMHDDTLDRLRRPRRRPPCHPRSRRCSPPASTTCRARSGRSWSPPPSSGCRSPSRRSRSSSRTALRMAVPAHLRALSRKQFVDRVVNNTSEDEIYRFRNLMIKDAVYASLLKRARATLHERFVTWAERVNRGARPRAGVRGDPRLPPRAGLPLPDGAGPARRRGPRDRRARRGQARQCRPARLVPGRHACGSVAAQACRCPPRADRR